MRLFLRFNAAFFLYSRPFRTFAGSGIGARALATDRQRAPVTQPAVTPQVHQTLYVHRDFCTQNTFHLVLGVNNLANAVNLGFGKVIGFGARIDIDLGENTIGCRSPDSINICKAYLNTFTPG